MTYRKPFTILICVLFAGSAFAQNHLTPENKKFEISEKLREKANTLVNSLAQDADQFFLPENRVNARLAVAGLLWDSDEKQARLLFQNAIGELSTLISNMNVGLEEKDEDYLTLYNLGNLRSKLLLEIAARDPGMALNAFQTLSPNKPDGNRLFDGDEALELQIASEIVISDPQKAYELAMKRLDDDSNYAILETLDAIFKKDEELGGKLASAMFNRIKKRIAGSTSVPVVPDPLALANLQVTDVPPGPPQINTWEIRSFYEKVLAINRQAIKTKKKPALSDAEMRDLLEILARKYVSQQYLGPYEVSGIMSEIEKSLPASAQAIRRKVESGTLLADMVGADDFQAEAEGKSTDEIITIIEKNPIAHRDELYQKAAEVAFAAGDIIRAKELYSRIKSKPQHDYIGSEIENQLPLALAAAGNVSNVREMLANVKSPEEKIEILTSLAVSLIAQGELKTARELAVEASSMYSGRARSRNDLGSILQLSQVQVMLEPDQGFWFLENNVAFVNEVIAAGILIEEFNDTGSVKSNEIFLSAVEGESYRNVKNGVALIRTLAKIDMDRTVALAERFARRESRFVARFRIAQALLDPKAETIEREFSHSFEDEHGDH